MDDDERCCGTGTCIIDAQGNCWCGQQWDGEKMCRPLANAAQTNTVTTVAKFADDGTVDSPAQPKQP